MITPNIVGNVESSSAKFKLEARVDGNVPRVTIEGEPAQGQGKQCEPPES